VALLMPECQVENSSILPFLAKKKLLKGGAACTGITGAGSTGMGGAGCTGIVSKEFSSIPVLLNLLSNALKILLPTF